MQQWNYLIQQTWLLPVLAVVGAFLAGLLIPRKGGSYAWVGAVVFFLPNLVLDLLDAVHTKKFKYYGLILALLAIEAFFAFRASTVYYDVLNTRMPGPEMAVVCVIVFTAVFLCGYMVATHGKLTFWSFCTMVFVIVHDWAGTVWMNYSTPDPASTNDQLKVILTIGMCVLGLLPFIMGAWAEELRPELEKEQEQEVNEFTSMATRKIKRRAVDRVLRLANHTDVVHLVRALPAEEFLDFKAFVMPIIAPGTPLNLIDQEPSNEQAETTQNDVLVEVKMNEQKPSNATQNDSQKSGKVTNQTMSKKPSNDSQNTTQKSVRRTTRKLSNDDQKSTQNDGQKPVTKTEQRDTKIRQFASTHDMTHAQLAKKFKVSVSTIARALSDGKPSTNGHSKERNTDEMEALVVTEGELVAAMN